jgi:cobalt-zinc-cadmium efflux system protein
LFNAILLLAAIVIIAWEAIRRFASPEPVTGMTVIWVAALGIVVNAWTALLFLSGRKGDLNVRGAFLHMAADAGVSLGVMITGILMILTSWPWLDAVVSLLIVVIIFVSTWKLLKDSLNMALDSVPPQIDSAAVRSFLESLPAVTDVHELHIWGMSTTETALTAHLVINEPNRNDLIIEQAVYELHERFGIEHPTLQIEYGTFPCRLSDESNI